MFNSDRKSNSLESFFEFYWGQSLCFMLYSLQKELREIKELRGKIAQLVMKLQEEAQHRQVALVLTAYSLLCVLNTFKMIQYEVTNLNTKTIELHCFLRT